MASCDVRVIKNITIDNSRSNLMDVEIIVKPFSFSLESTRETEKKRVNLEMALSRILERVLEEEQEGYSFDRNESLYDRQKRSNVSFPERRFGINGDGWLNTYRMYIFFRPSIYRRKRKEIINRRWIWSVVDD